LDQIVIIQPWVTRSEIPFQLDGDSPAQRQEVVGGA
jgi:hypothetical protein